MDGAAEARALRPLWLLTTGAVVGALCSSLTVLPPPRWLPPLLLLLGFASAIIALSWRRPARYELWLLAGLSLLCGRGLTQTAGALEVARLIADGETAIRARVVITEGWSEARWGRSSRVRVVAASLRGERVPLPRRCRLEVRGPTQTSDLPLPGVEVNVLARVRGSPRSPQLVVASPRLLKMTGDIRFLPAFRNDLARHLLDSADTDAGRIRTAEMAAALALGRRDLLPFSRRDSWRRSGLAHLLAVSGLHVGLVGGAVWLVLAVSGVGPRTTRLVVLATVPAYAVLAGAAPSAMRAALMAVIYLGARLLGRAVLPMAAVLLAATILLLVDPALVRDAGFQLTVVITGALVRWVPTLSTVLYGPRWLVGALAVPVVAQLSAAPIVAAHFRTLIPGALLANFLALPMLAPTILGSVAATVLASLSRAGAGLVLDLVGVLLTALRVVGTPARAAELVTPELPIVAAVALSITGWLALQAERRARIGAIGWVAVMALVGATWTVSDSTARPAVELLPVSDGAAVLVHDGGDALLVDSGRYPRESAQLLAENGWRSLRAVVATHTDDDHLGGLEQILHSFDVERLIVPAWMLADPKVVPLLRAARGNGVRAVPMAAGSSLSLGRLRLGSLWPPARWPPRQENERSLVAMTVVGSGSALLTADIGSATERILTGSRSLRAEVLVIPHHGGRGSTSPALLESVSPQVALIPAAAGNTHGHPHSEVMARLEARGIPYRYPARDGWCGARWDGFEWVAFP